MKVKKILRTILILIFLVSTIACDQISKNIVRQKINYNEQIRLVSNYVTLTKVENTGAFLSFGNALPQKAKQFILIILPLVSLGLVIVFMLTKKNLSNLILIAMSFIIGGGIGNIYDRFIYGSVTDFLHINFVIFQTGIFNMADVSVMMGMFIFLFEFYVKKVNLNFNLFHKQNT